MDSNVLRIMQVNLGRGKIATAEAIQLAHKNKVPIMLVQEPYTYCYQVSTFGKYSNQILTGNRENETPWACIVLFNREYHATILSDVSTSHCVCAYISGPSGGFYVISAYLQYSLPVEVVLQQVHNALRKVGNARVVIGMDANAISTLWTWRVSDIEDERGEAVENLIAQWNLTPLNREGELCTFKTGNRDIDLTLADYGTASKTIAWKVLDQVPSTDHRPIIFTIGDLPRYNRIIKMRYNVLKADWDAYASRMMELTTEVSEQYPILQSANDVQNFSKDIERIIIRAGDESIKRKTNFQKSVPWWTPELTKSKRECNRLRREYQKETDDEIREIKRLRYKEHRRLYTRDSLKAKKLSWMSFVETNSMKNPYGIVYKLAREKLNFKSPTISVLSGGSHTSDWKRTTEAILEGLFGSCEEEKIQTNSSSYETPTQAIVNSWDDIEVIKAVNSIRSGKSPGRDLIEVVMIKKAIGAGLLPLLVQLYNGCLQYGVFPKIWKLGIIRVLLKSQDKDPTKVRSYRPVCLLPVLSKVLERLIRNRLSPIILHPEFASPFQFGFRPKRSTEDAICKMRQAVAASETKMSLAVLFDITGAFDNLKWSSVIAELNKRGTDKNLVNLIGDYLKDRHVRVEENYEFVTKKLHKGCPQGSILGPDFWNICVDRLLNRLTEAGAIVVAYADDIIILVHGNSRRELESSAKEYVDIMVQWSEEEGLQLSKEKTEMIILKDSGMGKQPGKQVSKRGHKKKTKFGSIKGSLVVTGKGGRRPPTIRMGSTSIKYSPVVKYLGVKFGTRSTISTHVKEAISKGKQLFCKLGIVARANWGLKFSCLRTLYLGVFVPMILYAVGAWGDLLKNDHRKALISAQRLALLKITRAYRTTSTDALQVIGGFLPLDILALEYLHRFKVRVLEDFIYEGFHYSKNVKRSIANRRLREISIDLWQKRWDNSDKGRLTHRFFPLVRDRLRNKHFSSDFCNAQFSTGHGDFNYKLNYFNLTDDQRCICGEIENSNHVLLYCPLYDLQRCKLRNICLSKFSRWPVEMNEFVRNKLLFSVFSETCKLIMDQMKVIKN